jgi:hypothetical protein
MKRFSSAAVTLSCSLLATTFALGACGGGGDGDETTDNTGSPCDEFVIPGGDSNPGFAKPVDDEGNCILVEAWDDGEPAAIDLSCLGTPSDDQASSVEITLDTTVTDFQTGETLAGATVTVFNDIMIDDGDEFATGESGTDGELTVTIPAGTTRFGFKMVREDWFDTLLLNQYLDPDTAAQTIGEIQAVSVGTGTALPGLVGVTRTPGKGILAGTIRDCAGNELSGVIATVSQTPAEVEHVGGTRTYYFGVDSGLPVRNTVLNATSSNGLFAALEIDPTSSAFVQMWGILSEADLEAGTLTLIGELEVPVVGDVVITGSYEPLRQ